MFLIKLRRGVNREINHKVVQAGYGQEFVTTVVEFEDVCENNHFKSYERT